MPQSRIEEGRSYRERKKNSMGEDEYRAEETRKRRERRNRNKIPIPSPPPVSFEIKEPEEIKQPEQANEITLDAIYDAKLSMAQLKGHTIKRNSVETTLNRVKRLHKLMYGDDMTNFDWTKDTSKVSEFILSSDKWKSEETRIQQFQSLASILIVLRSFTSTYKFYSEQSVSMRQTKDSIDDQNLLTKREQANFLPWAKIKKIKPDNVHDEALIGLYTLLPPRRLEYRIMKLTTSEEDLDNKFNYLLLNGRNKPVKVIFLNYKTSSKFGKQEFPLTRALSSKLKAYINEAGLNDGDFLFGKSKTEAYKSFSSYVTKVFKKYTGKSLSVNLLRHSFISWYLKKTHSLAEQKVVANEMGHSVMMQLKYNRLDASDNHS